MTGAAHQVQASRVAVPGPGDRVAEEAVAVIRERTGIVPELALILGSGLGAAAGALDADAELDFDELPGFPRPSAPGHAGRLVVGSWNGATAAAFCGRIHFYEGHPMGVCALPVRVARLLGAHTLVVTAACGGLAPSLAPGDLVVAADHINFMGANPLRGWRTADGAPPFVDLTEVYDLGLAGAAADEAAALGIPVTSGVYIAVQGPSYETPAEVEFMRRAGASVVGMSVIPEAVPARALGMRVLGLFVVSNVAGPTPGGPPPDPTEVVRVAEGVAERLGRLLSALAPRLAERV